MFDMGYSYRHLEVAWYVCVLRATKMAVPTKMPFDKQTDFCGPKATVYLVGYTWTPRGKYK